MTKFAHLTLEEYAELHLQGHPELPKMPSAEVQRHWTWFGGRVGMERAIKIISGIRENYTSITGKAFEDATILDYGAGWGRITRLRFTLFHLKTFMHVTLTRNQSISSTP